MTPNMNDIKECPQEELERNSKKCWNPYCKNNSIFEDWGGWSWCFSCWHRNLKQANYKWFYFKTTKIILRMFERKRAFNPVKTSTQ